ncbi:MAG: HEPN domain-containing protein [Flammeovirgaceae bacterium]|nr:HEPN domain-containing protein [Flammeovirgaceae bacterium]
MDEKKYNPWEEWSNQAEYDFGTAEAMFQSQRLVYVVFFCHLSLEKLLKSLWVKKFNSVPPKTHNLLFLIEQLQIEEIKFLDFISDLNGLSIPTRYPDSLQKLTQQLNKEKAYDFLMNTKKVMVWLKNLT